LLGEKEIRLGEQQGNRWIESMLRRRRIIDGKCGMRTGCLSQCEYMKSLDTHTHTHRTHTHGLLVTLGRFIHRRYESWTGYYFEPSGSTDRLVTIYLCILLFFSFQLFHFFFTVSLYATLNSLYVYKYPTLKRKTNGAITAQRDNYTELEGYSRSN